MKVTKQGIIGAKQIKPNESPDVSSKQDNSQFTPVNDLDQLDETAVKQPSEWSAVSKSAAGSRGNRSLDVRAALENSANWSGFSADPEKLAALLSVRKVIGRAVWPQRRGRALLDGGCTLVRHL